MGCIVRKKKGGRDLGWYIRWMENGRRRELASHQPTHALARRMLVEIEARVARGLAGLVERDASARRTVAQLFDKYLAEYANPRLKDVAKHRLKNTLIFQRLRPLIGELRVAELRAQDVARARDALGKKYAPGTVRNTVVALSSVCAWAVTQNLLEKNPVLGVSRPPLPEPRRDYLSSEEARALLAEAARRARVPGEEGLAWRSKSVAIALALRLGLRKGELFGLRWRDVDLEQQRLTVARSYATTPKSGKPRHLRIPAALLVELKAWRAHCPKTAQGLVCPVRIRTSGRFTMANHTGSDHGLPELLRAAGCRVFSRPWHLLRHSFASHFVQSGGSLLALSQILGHSDVRLSMIYAHLSGDYLLVELEKVKF